MSDPQPSWPPPQPTSPPPPPPAPVTPSALTGEVVDAFARAAADRHEDDEQDDLGPLAPPYDPERERRTVKRGGRRRREPDPQEDLRVALTTASKYRVRVIRSHIKWVRKMAQKNNIPIEAVNLWEI